MAIKHPDLPADAFARDLSLVRPCQGACLYKDSAGTILFGAPPEVFKRLLRHGLSNFDTVVLPDFRKKVAR